MNIYIYIYIRGGVRGEERKEGSKGGKEHLDNVPIARYEPAPEMIVIMPI